MTASRGVWAVVPVKEFDCAKDRLSRLFSPDFRRKLAATMLEDVLDALARVAGLAGIVVVTLDPAAAKLARRFDARIVTNCARSGHTGAVAAGIDQVLTESGGGMLAIPGDVPGATTAEIEYLLGEHATSEGFTITPAHDGRGSNAIVSSPPDRVPLAFGTDSFLPHLDAARRRGIEPRIVRLEGIGLDIDNPEDLFAYMARRRPTRTSAFLQRWGRLSAVGAQRGEMLRHDG